MGASASFSYSNSKKIYVSGGSLHRFEVPFREINLSMKDRTPRQPLQLYDASGPYSDASYSPNSNLHFPKPRETWLKNQAGTKFTTQMGFARRGIITPEMEFVAIREECSVESVITEVAAGRVVRSFVPCD